MLTKIVRLIEGKIEMQTKIIEIDGKSTRERERERERERAEESEREREGELARFKSCV